MTTLINRIINHLTDPAIWGVITTAFSAPDHQATLRLYQKNPAAMQAMLMEELSEKLAHNPALVAQFAALLMADTPDTWHIEGENVGIVNANNANFQGAQNVNITGLNIQAPSPLPLSQREKGNDSHTFTLTLSQREKGDSLAPWERAGVRVLVLAAP